MLINSLQISIVFGSNKSSSDAFFILLPISVTKNKFRTLTTTKMPLDVMKITIDTIVIIKSAESLGWCKNTYIYVYEPTSGLTSLSDRAEKMEKVLPPCLYQLGHLLMTLGRPLLGSIMRYY